MSSRIEKGGAKFKPSIVPRRSGTAASPSGASISQPSPRSATSSVLPPSPSLRAQSSGHGVQSSVGSATTPTSTLTRPSQSYAFNASPSVIGSTNVDAPSTSGFRRPAVVKPRPGSRASLTPAPQYQQPQTRTAKSSSHAANQTHNASVSKSSAASEHASTSTSEAAPGTARTKLAPPANAIRPDQREAVRTSASSSAVAESATSDNVVKQSASQVEALASTTTPIVDPVLELVKSAQLPSASRVSLSTKAVGKARVTDGEESDADDDRNPEEKAKQMRQRRADAAARRAKRRLKRKEADAGKPKRPPSAYILFVNSVRSERNAQNPGLSLTELTTAIAAEWRQLSPAQKHEWEQEATACRQRYDNDLAAWTRAFPDGLPVGSDDDSSMETTSELDEQGEPVRRRKKRKSSSRKARTVSDDEAEYEMQVHTQGPALAASRLDPSAMTMGEISTILFRQGRAGPRTFETDRVYKRMVDDRRIAAKEALLGSHALGTKPDTTAATPHLTVRSNTTRDADGEIIAHTSEDEHTVDASEVEESAPEESGPETEASGDDEQMNRRLRRRKREVSVAGTDVSFRENRFAVQTRIVDGKIVLDETSLYASFDNGEQDRENMEIVDEREGDRFVNSATYSRKLGRNRKWSADETAHFFRALQQWGTDFEMIARLFPGRDRVMIKKKYNAEERANPTLIDQALRNTVPVNLEAYASAIGVDLSGPPPEIKADIHDIESLALAADASQKIKKRENTAPLGTAVDREADEDDDDDGYEHEELVEIDEQGNETTVRRRLGRKTTATPVPAKVRSKKARKIASTGSGAEDASSHHDATTAAPVVSTRKSTRTKGKQSTAPSRQHHTTDAPGDNMEVEEIIGEL